jgi:hypothetical protein
LVAPREIAGVAAGLQQGLESEGLEVDIVLRWPHPFAYAMREPRSRLWRLAGRSMVEPDDGTARPWRRAVSLVVRVALIPLVPLRYSAVIYLGPDTLLRGGRDRRWLTRRGVRTVTVFLGSEARPPYLDGAFARGESTAELESVRQRTHVHKNRVRQAEQDSTYVVNHPGTGQFQSRPYLDWTVLGFPSIARDAPAAGKVELSGAPILLHAPSNVSMKGTDRIRAAADELVRAGIRLRYVEISGRPHAEVLAAVANADLVVDQLYSDTLLPGLATEAARLGTPVLVFGYAADLLCPLAERSGLSTLHYAHPDDLMPVLRRLLTDATARIELQASLSRCVAGPWSAQHVASRWAKVVQGVPSPDWFDQPDTLPYVHGCAIERDRLVGFLSRYVTAFGPPGLELDSAPRTLAAALALVGEHEPERLS